MKDQWVAVYRERAKSIRAICESSGLTWHTNLFWFVCLGSRTSSGLSDSCTSKWKFETVLVIRATANWWQMLCLGRGVLYSRACFSGIRNLDGRKIAPIRDVDHAGFSLFFQTTKMCNKWSNETNLFWKAQSLIFFFSFFFSSKAYWV